MRRQATDVMASLDESKSFVPGRRHARDRADLDTSNDQRVAGCDTGAHVDDPQRRRRVRTATVHAFDELLARVAPLRETDRHRHHTGDGGNRLAGNDLESHARPPDSDPGDLVAIGGRRGRGGLDADLGVHSDLEPVQPGCERLAVPGVEVEVEPVVANAGHARQRLDLARGLENEGPCCGAGRKVTEVLGDLGVKVGERVRTIHDHVVTGGFVDCGLVGSHTDSLPWHTAIVMTNDDSTRDSRLHDLAARAVDSLLTLVHRGTRLAFGTMVIVVVVCLSGVALGIAALSDGMETVWILFGGVAACVAIGSVGLAMFRLWVITTLGTALVSDVEQLIAGDPRSERVVIETVEASDGVQDQSAVVMSRQFFTMSDTVGTAGQFTALAIALKSVTTFPWLILLATVITIGFAGLGFLFLLGIIL